MNDINKLINSTNQFVNGIQNTTNKMVKDAMNQQNKNIQNMNGNQGGQYPYSNPNPNSYANPPYYQQPQPMNCYQPQQPQYRQNTGNQNFSGNYSYNPNYQQPQNYNNYGGFNNPINPNYNNQNNQYNQNLERPSQNIGNSQVPSNIQQQQSQPGLSINNLLKGAADYFTSGKNYNTNNQQSKPQQSDQYNLNHSHMESSQFSQSYDVSHYPEFDDLSSHEPQPIQNKSNNKPDNILSSGISMNLLSDLNEMHKASSQNIFSIDVSKISQKKSYMSDLESIPFVASLNNETYEDSKIEIIKNKIYSGYNFKGSHARVMIKCLEYNDSRVSSAKMLVDYIYDGQIWQMMCPIEYNDSKLNLADELILKSKTTQNFSLLNTVPEVLEIETLIDFLKQESWPEVQLKMLELALKCGNRTNGENAKKILCCFQYCNDQIKAGLLLKGYLVDNAYETMVEGILYQDERLNLLKKLRS
jgi:hypothetical protein